MRTPGSSSTKAFVRLGEPLPWLKVAYKTSLGRISKGRSRSLPTAAAWPTSPELTKAMRWKQLVDELKACLAYELWRPPQ